MNVVSETDAGWVLLIVSCLAWAVVWCVEFRERKKMDANEWRDARLRMGLSAHYRHNRRIS